LIGWLRGLAGHLIQAVLNNCRPDDAKEEQQKESHYRFQSFACYQFNTLGEFPNPVNIGDGYDEKPGGRYLGAKGIHLVFGTDVPNQSIYPERDYR
jgi:hypothetical protein